MANSKRRDIFDADLIKVATAAEATETDSRDIIEYMNTALFQYKILL